MTGDEFCTAAVIGAFTVAFAVWRWIGYQNEQIALDKARRQRNPPRPLVMSAREVQEGMRNGGFGRSKLMVERDEQLDRIERNTRWANYGIFFDD